MKSEPEKLDFSNKSLKEIADYLGDKPLFTEKIEEARRFIAEHGLPDFKALKAAREKQA
ncbi:MAG: hypothetical protein V4543_13945 [Bacteroidota bacterium]